MHYPIQTNYTAGELSPRLALRVDFNKYANGLETLENYVVLPHGGVKRAAGTRFVAEVKDSTKSTRLIPFEFSTTQAYICEFSNLFIRFYKDGGRIEDPPGTPVTIASPYLEADLFDIKYAQSADTLYLVHPSYAPRKLTRTSHILWTLTEVTFLDGPWFDPNLITPNTPVSAITITPSAVTGAITLTASSALWVATDVGRFVRLFDGTSAWGYAVITLYTSPTVVNATVVLVVPAGARTVWQLGAWSSTTGYPGAISFFEERLAFAGSTMQPQAVWLSMSSDYEDFTPGANDDAALTYVLASNQVNAIKWLSSGVGLLIGTVGGEFALFGGNDSPLSPTNVTVRRQSTRGSFGVAPVTVGTSTMFVQRAGRKIRELAFNPDSGVYNTPDLTLLAEHITSPYIVEMSYQQEPDSIVWCVRADGALVAFTYNPEQEVLAFGLRVTNGLFESVATIPSPDQDGDQTWVIVKRVIGGVFKRYVEYMDPTLYVDSGLTYSGVAVGSVTGLSHLEGHTVDIVGDGAVYPQEVVTSATVTLEGPDAEEIQVGLHYLPVIVTLRPEVKMANGGTSQGKKKRWAEVFVRLYESLGLTIEDDKLQFRSASDPMDEPPPIFTGDKRVTASGWNDHGQLEFRQDQPLPSTILGHFGTLDVGGDGE